MNEQQLAGQNMNFFTRSLVGQHFSVNPNRPTGGTWGRQCLRCKDIEIIGPCSNCGNELYVTSDAEVSCTRCGLGYSRWTCTDCGADNPIAATFGGIKTKGACFIATAAYGAELAPEVVTFRAFRDCVLIDRVLGRAFISAYYRVSPPLADFVSRHEFLRRITRSVILGPLLRVIRPFEKS